MIDVLKNLFTVKAGQTEEQRAVASERAVRLAAGVLLFEIVRADGQVSDAERTVMRASLQGTFGLAVAECDELMLAAEQQSCTATSLYEFTSVVDAVFSGDQKKRIVELLWLVAFADGSKDASEEHMVRKIAGLLHVAHPDFIDAKIRARGQSEIEPRG